MNPIRSLLIFLLATSVLCADSFNLDGKESKNSLIISNLMIDNRELEVFGKAVSSILQKAVNEFLIVRIIIVGSNYQFQHEISEIMRISQEKFVIEVMDYEYFLKAAEKLEDADDDEEEMSLCKEICNGVCILLFESLEVFKKFKDPQFMKDDDLIIRVRLVFVRGATAEQVLTVNQINDYDLELIPDTSNELSIVDAEEFLDLMEMNRFVVGDECSRTAMVTINRFSKTKMEWEKPLQRLERRGKFNGCIVGFRMQPNQATVMKTLEGENIFSGAFVDILKLVAEMGSFKVQFHGGYPRDQDSSEGLPGIQNQSDMIVIRKVIEDNKRSISDARFMERELYFVIPQGELYTEWEKLFLVFDEATWLLIVITFAAAFVVIIFINNFTNRVTRNFVFGRNVTTPALNVLKIFFGLGQMVLPNRNFARFLLTLFIIWTLIIRTCYQGLLFEYLIGDGRKPGINSFDELLSRNFTYHANDEHCRNLIDVNLTGK